MKKASKKFGAFFCDIRPLRYIFGEKLALLSAKQSGGRIIRIEDRG